MHRVGLNYLVAPSVAHYIDVARGLATDGARLQELRWSLRDRMLGSELMDSSLFTSHLEEVYHRLWQQYCASIVSN